MQALIPLIATLGVVSGLIIPPRRPISHQHYQNTKTGEYSYSYVGDSSAKEETRDVQGVTRGSYNYVDANGKLQYTLYVADKDGFRVGATNLPYGYNLETADLLVDGQRVVVVDASNPEKPSKNASQQPKQNSSQAVLTIGTGDILPLIMPSNGWIFRRLDLPLVLIPSEVQDQGNPLGNPQKDADKEKPLDKPWSDFYRFDRKKLLQQLGLEGLNLKNIVVIPPSVVAKDAVPPLPSKVPSVTPTSS